MKFLAAALLGLAVALNGVPGVTAPATAQAQHGWRLAGAYRCYETACHKANQLKACGYSTCIRWQSGYWCVYYR